MRCCERLVSPVEDVEERKELNERFSELEFAAIKDDGGGRVEEDADGAQRWNGVGSNHHLHVGQPWRVLHSQGGPQRGREAGKGQFRRGGVVGRRRHRRFWHGQVEDAVFVCRHCCFNNCLEMVEIIF